MENPVNKEQIWAVLEDLIDPELGLSFPQLGLIYNIDFDHSKKDVYIEYTLTTPGCPIADTIEEQMDNLIKGHNKNYSTRPTLVWEPMWNPSMMSEDAKFAFGY